MRSNTTLVRLLWTGVWVLAFIGIAAAAHRILSLEFPEKFSRSNSPAAVLDIGFTQHKMLTLVHVLPGVLFMVLGPLQLSRAIRNKYLNFHRWSGRALMLVSSASVVGGFYFGVMIPFGGTREATFQPTNPGMQRCNRSGRALQPC